MVLEPSYSENRGRRQCCPAPDTCALLVAGVLILGWLSWRDLPSRRQLMETAVPIIFKQPVQFRENARLIRPTRRPICRR